MKPIRELSVILSLFFIGLSCAVIFNEEDRVFPEWSGHRYVPVPKMWIRSDLSEYARATEEMHIIFGLKQRNRELLEERLWKVSDPDSPEYGNYMTLDELADFIQPEPEKLEILNEWLASYGILHYDTVRTGDFIEVDAPVSVVEKMLRVRIDEFVHEETHTRILRSVVPYSIPRQLAEIVDIVFGVTSFPARRIHLQTHQVVPRQSVTPRLIQSTFNINMTGSNKKNIQAVAQFLEQYYNPNDLKRFQTTFGVPVQAVEKVIGPNKPNNPGIEASLDIEYIMAVGQKIRTWFYYTDGLHKGQEPFLQWMMNINNETEYPFVISVSYGDFENSIGVHYINKLNFEFAKAGLRGITILFASGDWGVGCTSSCAKFSPVWPASSPYVTSVGGVVYQGSNPLRLVGDVISSGGFSNVNSMPPYQKAAVQKYLNSAGDLPPKTFWNSSGRAMPDIASYSEDVIIVSGGSEMPVAGTSCAAPVVAGILSLVNDVLLSKGKKTLGFFNPLLYKVVAAHPEAVFDVTQGQNPYGCCPGFSAAPGWDPVTGWGAPNFKNFLNAILHQLGIADDINNH